MNRKQEREQAFILVFEKMFREESMDEIFECAAEAGEFVESDYVIDISKGVYEKLDEVDSLISKNSNGWAINRISKVSLAVMRIAIFEMLFRDDIPVSVSINEAIDLIKKYATEQDGAFANGILGTVAKGIDK